jgi:hypothetical protein
MGDFLWPPNLHPESLWHHSQAPGNRLQREIESAEQTQ